MITPIPHIQDLGKPKPDPSPAEFENKIFPRSDQLTFAVFSQGDLGAIHNIETC